MNFIKIDFEYTTNYGTFRDALHLHENHGFTDAEITSMKEQRLNNWIANVSTSTTITEPDYSEWFEPITEVISDG